MLEPGSTDAFNGTFSCLLAATATRDRDELAFGWVGREAALDEEGCRAVDEDLDAGDLVTEHVHVVGKHHRVDFLATNDRAPDAPSDRVESTIQSPNEKDEERGRETGTLMHPDNYNKNGCSWNSIKKQLEAVPDV
jgi:hypothetical protein